MRWLWVAGIFFLLGFPAEARVVTVDETIGQIVTRHAPVLCEVPASPAGAEALDYVRGIHERFFRESGLQVVSQWSEEARQQRLRDGFVLFGVLTPQSLATRLLRETLGPDRAVPVSDGQIIFVAKNPYGAGPVVVYAATTPSWLTGINRHFHGPASFHLFAGDRLLETGRFNEKFQLIHDPLPLDQALEDAAFFFEQLEEIHPHLLAKSSQTAHLELKSRTRSDIQRAARLDQVSHLDLARVLYAAAAFFQDGHTALHWREQPTPQNDVPYPPFTLRFENGRFLLDAVATPLQELKGRPLLSVNGRPTLAFLKPVLDRCSGEILPFRAARFESSQPFYWWLAGGVSNADLTFTVQSGAAVTSHVLPAVNGETFSALDADRRSTVGWEMRHQRLSGDVVYFRYPSFAYSDDAIARIDSLFKELSANPVRHLVIDIRGNGGGSSRMCDALLRHVTDRPVRTFSGGRTKISRALLAAFPEEYADYRDQIGKVIGWTLEPRRLDPTPYPFRGQVWVLIDHGTFSSATDFAAMVQSYQLGTLVGEETGGLSHSFGDVLFQSLPHSEIPFGVSFKEFFAPVPQPGDDQHGVLPDIPLTSESLDVFQDQVDPALAWLLHHLKGLTR